MKIKKSDNVMVLSGKDRGKTGIVERVFPEENKVVIKGIALAKKNVKPSKKNPKGGILDINLKVSSSKIMVFCPNCSKPTKIGYQISDKGKMRICKKCNQSLENRIK